MKYCAVFVLLCVYVSVVQGASESRGSEENRFKEDSVDEIAGELSICPGELVNFYNTFLKFSFFPFSEYWD